MAKKSMVLRDQNRAELTRKYAKLRTTLKELISSPRTDEEDRHKAVVTLSKLPRDGSYVRRRNRCSLTGRSRGYYRRFGLGRSKLRDLAFRGDIPGLVKASW